MFFHVCLSIFFASFLILLMFFFISHIVFHWIYCLLLPPLMCFTSFACQLKNRKQWTKKIQSENRKKRRKIGKFLETNNIHYLDVVHTCSWDSLWNSLQRNDKKEKLFGIRNNFSFFFSICVLLIFGMCDVNVTNIKAMIFD